MAHYKDPSGLTLHLVRSVHLAGSDDLVVAHLQVEKIQGLLRLIVLRSYLLSLVALPLTEVMPPLQDDLEVYPSLVRRTSPSADSRLK